jgi:protein-disulfide isomerase
MNPIEPAVDHVRGDPAGPLILEYGDYECPYSRRAYREIERVESRLGGRVRFAFRHFPLVDKHPHALAASAAAEAAALQGRFWEMHDILFHRQKALEDDDLRRYGADIGLDVARFERDRAGDEVRARVRRDVTTGTQSGVRGTPTIFIEGVVWRGSYEAAVLLAELDR